MDSKQFKLKPHQVEALKELRKRMGEDVERWTGGKTEVVRRMACDYADLEAAVHVQEFGRSRRVGKKLEFAMFGCTTVTMAAVMAHREFTRSIAQNRENTLIGDEIQIGGNSVPIPRDWLTGVWYDEAHIVDELPFTSREETPFCRSVRVWDAKGFTPAVELCNRHPLLLVANDWRRATTFDLYAMAIKASRSLVADLNIKNILAIKWWVTYMDDVKHLKFDDVTAPAQVYNDAMYAGRFKFLFSAAVCVKVSLCDGGRYATDQRFVRC